MRRALSGRLSWRWLAAAAAAFIADLVLHLPVTDFFDAIAARIGFFTYNRLLTAISATVAGAVVAGAVGWGRRAAGHRQAASMGMRAGRAVRAFTLLLVALAAGAQALFLVASIENIHYPQYALLAYLLGRSGLSLEASWLGATGLGIVDEANQWLVLRRGTPSYLDWNDIFYNAIGAGFGIVALLIRRGAPRAAPSVKTPSLRTTARVSAIGVQDSPAEDAGAQDQPSRVARTPTAEVLSQSPAQPLCRTATALTIIALAVATGILLKPPHLRPFFTVTPIGIHYHILSPGEGLLLMGGLWLVLRRMLAAEDKDTGLGVRGALPANWRKAPLDTPPREGGYSG